MHRIKEKLENLKHQHEAQNQIPVQGGPSQPSHSAPFTSTYPGAKTNKQPYATNPTYPNNPTQPTSPANPALLAKTQHAIVVFFASLQPNGEIGGIGYWQTANGYTATCLHDQYTHSSPSPNLARLETAVAKVHSHHRDLINDFNDDTLWWGNLLLDMHTLSRGGEGEHDHFATAARIQQHVSRSVIRQGQAQVQGLDMQGAVMWTTGPREEQTNAITTGLYAELCARLAHLSSPTSPRGDEWVARAEEALQWVLRCRYRPRDALVLDTINLRKRECMDWTFTYTTGQAMAACVALFTALTRRAQSEKADYYLDAACQMARKSLVRPGWVDANGVLTEHGAYGKGNHEPWKNDDAVGFKSVLVRALGKLFKVLRETDREEGLQGDIKLFVRRQWESLEGCNTNGKGQYGPWWAGPMEMPTSHSQLAILDVLAVIHLVQ